jgi:hypothetical protein
MNGTFQIQAWPTPLVFSVGGPGGPALTDILTEDSLVLQSEIPHSLEIE